MVQGEGGRFTHRTEKMDREIHARFGKTLHEVWEGFGLESEESMTVRSVFKKKRSDIRFKYGEKAAKHFEKNYYCEICHENRFACLTIHHTEGKKVDKFQTLCFNCHMITHAPKSGEMTMAHEHSLEAEKVKKKATMLIRDNKIFQFFGRGLSLREIGKQVGVGHNTVRVVLLKFGVKSKLKN